MATFNSYQGILPDPNNLIAPDGSSSNTAIAGPGYRSVSVTSITPTIRDTSNSGRVYSRTQVAHKWEIKITYNPLTRTEFNVLYSFLLEKESSLKPFLVSLPQYVQGKGTRTAAQTITRQGATNMLLDAPAAGQADPAPGDLFTGIGNPLETKAYSVTRVETSTNHLENAGMSAGQIRITFTPPLFQTVETSTSSFNFESPLIRVILKSKSLNYSLDSNNLYNLSLTLEEALP